ncbi:MAG: DUF2490 domain-containing protein [Saprospiraceae bacterium]|nr:DUF2490 domain-containing protein [Candidatus Vicinibacter affinis]MBK6572862.1 DUF2490 domain-containing protein [Candidatus Vicinibacter affinis]
MRFFIIFLIILSNKMVFAQTSKTGNWLIYFGNQPINKKWNVWNEVQYRNYNFVGDLQQFLIRTGVGYNLSENNNNVLMGYAYVYSENYFEKSDAKLSSEEHRIYQQFLTRQNFTPFAIQHRYRIEERFLQGDFHIRFRYALSIQVPLNHSTLTKNTLYLSASNEIFIKNSAPLFDRDRIYLGLGYVINPIFRVEVGMMSQILENTHRNQFQIAIFNSMPIKFKTEKNID